ncbi:hypothetical protein MMC30_003651 [Trapelia coarctata]|nr:hypothetical protein [Trapelia coarctata]
MENDLYALSEQVNADRKDFVRRYEAKTKQLDTEHKAHIARVEALHQHLNAGKDRTQRLKQIQQLREVQEACTLRRSRVLEPFVAEGKRLEVRHEELEAKLDKYIKRMRIQAERAETERNRIEAELKEKTAEIARIDVKLERNMAKRVELVAEMEGNKTEREEIHVKLKELVAERDELAAKVEEEKVKPVERVLKGIKLRAKRELDAKLDQREAEINERMAKLEKGNAEGNRVSCLKNEAGQTLVVKQLSSGASATQSEPISTFAVSPATVGPQSQPRPLPGESNCHLAPAATGQSLQPSGTTSLKKKRRRNKKAKKNIQLKANVEDESTSPERGRTRVRSED